MAIDASLNPTVPDGAPQPVLTVWNRIVGELADLQDVSSGVPGSVVNPVYGRPYVVDTCCAALVFAAEHRRTADARWRTRADAALRAAQSSGLFSGVGEPHWQGQGWREVTRSLTATGIAVDACHKAACRLGWTIEPDEIRSVIDLVASCRTATNGFAHDTLEAGPAMPDVQNATASALNLLGRLAAYEGAEGNRVYASVDAALLRLGSGQTRAGFWPYSHPGRRQRLREALDRQPFRALLGADRFDRHGRWGDLAHHLMTLYFAAGYFASRPRLVADRMLVSGWSWTRARLVDNPGGLSIDWSGDPAPSAPQNSNARDTNAYFLVVGALPRLHALGVVADDEADVVASGLLRHVASNLLREPGQKPCIVPAEGPPDAVANLLPMFEQSVAWKGRLLAGLVDGWPGAPA